MSIYLSRLILNPRSRAARHDLGHPHELHRTLMRAFPQTGTPGRAREQLGVLYRIDAQRATGEISVLVQSRERPDWGALAAGYLLPPGDMATPRENPACKPIDAAWARLRAGDEFIFRLRANPTRRISASAHPDDPLAGKRVELQTEEEQLRWLARKGQDHGFDLLAVRVDPALGGAEAAQAFGIAATPATPPDIRTIPAAKLVDHARKLRFGSVLFEGRLRVTDVERFRAALETGIGSGKAYGFGLLSIAPAAAMADAAGK